MPDMVNVHHPEAGDATVPRSALRQMDPRWQIVDDDPAAAPEETPAEPENEPATKPRRRRSDEEN